MVSGSDATHLFLQACLSRRCFSDKIGRMLWRKSCEAVKAIDQDVQVPYDEEHFDEFVEEVNKHLGEVNLVLRAQFDEMTGRKMWGLTNQVEDDASRLATEYNPAEIAFFKSIFDDIINAPGHSYSISSIEALKKLKDAKTGKATMTRSHGEVLLSSFVANGWLARSQKGRYSLAVRSILELGPQISQDFIADPDQIECTLCHEILTKGVRCPHRQCRVKIHNHCYANLRRQNTCMACGQEWVEDQLIKVGEGAPVAERGREDEDDSDEEEQTLPKKTRKPAAAKGKGRGKKKTMTDDEEEDVSRGVHDMDVDDDDEEEPEEAPARTQSRRSGGRRQ